MPGLSLVTKMTKFEHQENGGKQMGSRTDSLLFRRQFETWISGSYFNN